jgi:hypothetical protein
MSEMRAWSTAHSLAGRETLEFNPRHRVMQTVAESECCRPLEEDFSIGLGDPHP